MRFCYVGLKQSPKAPTVIQPVEDGVEVFLALYVRGLQMLQLFPELVAVQVALHALHEYERVVLEPVGRDVQDDH